MTLDPNISMLGLNFDTKYMGGRNVNIVVFLITLLSLHVFTFFKKSPVE